MSHEHEWRERVVLITGAATGIGALVVRLVAQEGAKHVAVLDVVKREGVELQDELNRQHGAGTVAFYNCDVTDEPRFLAIFDAVKREQGYIDVVINNAAIMNDRLDAYKKEIEINVTALVTATLKAIEVMRRDRGGRGGSVLNISSVAGIRQNPLLPVYFATKSAVLQFSNCIGMDAYYSRTGVRVLAICFGPTKTPLLSADKLGSFDPEYEHHLVQYLEKTPVQTPDHAAQGVVEAFKRGASGSTWLVDGGRPAQDISGDVQTAYAIMSSKIS